MTAGASTSVSPAHYPGAGMVRGVSTTQLAAALTPDVPQTYTLTIVKAGTGSGTVTSSLGNINCGTVCSATFASGANPILTAVPATGSTFTGWSGGCTVGESPTTCFALMNAAKSVTATFTTASPTATYSIALNPSGSNGTILSTPAGINCSVIGGYPSGSCGANFPAGTTVTLTTTPASGGVFTSWNGGCSGSSTTCTLTMNQNYQLGAIFSSNTYTLTIVKAGTGTGTVISSPAGINCGGSGTTCSATFTKGTIVTLTATPGTNSTFGGHSSNCLPDTAANPCSVTMDADITILEQFLGTAGEAIKIVSPYGGEVWHLGDTYKIQWQNSDVPPTSRNVQLYTLAANSPTTCLIANSVPDTGSYTWKIPTSLDKNCWGTHDLTVLRLDGSNIIGRSAKFTISSTPSSMFKISEIAPLTSPYPLGGNVIVKVRGIEPDGTWTTADESFQASGQVYIDNGPHQPTLYSTTTTYDTSTGWWTTTVPAPSVAGIYKMRVVIWCGFDYGKVCSDRYGSGGPQVEQMVPFTVGMSTTGAINIITPNGGETLTPGSVYKISWDQPSNLPTGTRLVINLMKQGREIFQPYNGDANIDQRSADWTVPTGSNNILLNNGGSDYTIKILAAYPNGTWSNESDVSDAPFTILPSKVIGLITPAQPVTWQNGKSYVVGWSTGNISTELRKANARIDLLDLSNNVVYSWLSPDIMVSSDDSRFGRTSFAVPDGLKGDYSIRVVIPSMDDGTGVATLPKPFYPRVEIQQSITPRPCSSTTAVIKRGPLGNNSFADLKYDVTTHPEILKYRIQWFSGAWSSWFTPGVDDVDWKTPADYSRRRVWAYFGDHNHEFQKCGVATAGKPDLIVSSISLEPAAPLPGQKLVVRAVLKNIGTADAVIPRSWPLSGPSASLYIQGTAPFYVPGTVYSYGEGAGGNNPNNENPPIPPGGSGTLTFGISTAINDPSGQMSPIILPLVDTYTFKVVADGGSSSAGGIGVIDELKEDNNTLVRTIVVGGAAGHWRGDERAVVTLEEWVDYQDPFGVKYETTISSILSNYSGKVNLVVKPFPLAFHALAQKGAEAAECAAAQNEIYFWKFHDWFMAQANIWTIDSVKAYANQLGQSAGIISFDATAFTKCLDSGDKATVVKDYLTEGGAKDIRGIPTTFVIRYKDGAAEKVVGAVPYEMLKAAVDKMLGSGVSTQAPVASTTGTATPLEQALLERIRQLEYKVSELERQVVASEKALTLKVDAKLVQQVAGKILLQVDGNGEAWYVDKDSSKRFYLKDGSTAYTALQAFGLGITDANLAKLPVGVDERIKSTDSDDDGLDDALEQSLGTNPAVKDSDNDGYDDTTEINTNFNPTGAGTSAVDNALLKKLEGKIMLQVENQGQAWYVTGGKRYYMKDGEAAYKLMRFKSLGIKNEDLRKIGVGEFEVAE